MKTTCGFPNMTLKSLNISSPPLDIAVAMFDMTNYAADIPSYSYPLYDNETWTSTNLRSDTQTEFGMAMIGGDDGSVQKCGVKRVMLVTVSNFNKPQTT
jgi:hypothetical protein